MCVLCNEFTSSATGGFHDLTATAVATGANITETTDAAASTATGYTMAVGDTFSGSLSVAGDRDWVAVTLTAGQSIEIDLTGSPSGHGTLSDPYLRLYNGSGTLVALNDDGGTGFESRITYTATTGGTFYISAGAYNDASTGTYRITVAAETPPPVADLDTLADYLTDGYWQDNGGAGRSFDTSTSNQITVNLTGLTAAGQQLARWALEAWEMVANLDFVETTATGADIVFDDNRSGAFSTSTLSGGTILSSDVNISTNWLSTYGTTLDSYSFQTYIHEIGHALGLGHQGAYNGAATYGTDETYANDSWQISIMSYFSQTDNTTVNASFATLLSAMMADVVAIQNLYGAPGASSATAGNTIWGTGTNLGGYYGDLANGTAGVYNGGPVAYTIYDRGGIDRIDTTGLTGNQRIDLNDEAFSDIGGLIGNVGIARGTVVENAFTGTGTDTITGNEVANDIRSGGGNDSVNGAAGNDTLNGQAGNDTITGGGGNDTFVMSTGADRITDFNATSSAERIDLRGIAAITSFADLQTNHMSQVGANVVINAGGGTTLTLVGVTLASLDAGDFIFSGGGGGGGTPTAGDDTLIGTAGNDNINGLGGNDSISGLAGNDDLRGSAGNDTLLGGDGRDTLGAGDGNDEVRGGNQGDLVFGGSGRDLLYGDGGYDRVFTGTGNDTAYGGNGNDTLGGGQGNDRLFAGNNDDRIFGSNGTDSIGGGTGNDVIFGGNHNDTLLGGGGNDTIGGGAGRDTIEGGAGNDSLTGGGDNDTFVYDGGVDVITDFNAFSGAERVDLSGVAAITGWWDLSHNHMSQVGANVVINALGGNTLTLNNVTLANLDAGDFIF